jgi:hypothetical protein
MHACSAANHRDFGVLIGEVVVGFAEIAVNRKVKMRSGFLRVRYYCFSGVTIARIDIGVAAAFRQLSQFGGIACGQRFFLGA